MKEGYLVPEIYSKPTDSHKYLNPSTEHLEHVTKGIPYSVGLRIRRNCSDKSVGDKIFIDKLVEYKGYLLDSGYNSQKIDKQFLKVAQIHRKKLLEGRQSKRQTRQEETDLKINFVVSHDPTFPDIRKAINRHYHILEGDEQCARLFPKGTFRVCSRRGNWNLKEWIAPTRYVGPKRVDEENRGNWKCGSCCKSVTGRKRESGIYNCDVMEEATNFRSKATKEKYKIRQNINCRSKNVIYLVECKKCGKQGVGSTGEFAPRISNYITHIENKHEMTCVAQHFWEQDHSVKDLSIKGIVKLVNPPRTKKAKTNMLEDFECYWQARLNTFKPFGLNDFKEYQEHRKRRGKDYLVKFLYVRLVWVGLCTLTISDL